MSGLDGSTGDATPVVAICWAGFPLDNAPSIPELALSNADIPTEPRNRSAPQRKTAINRARRRSPRASGPSKETRIGLIFITHALNTEPTTTTHPVP